MLILNSGFNIPQAKLILKFVNDDLNVKEFLTETSKPEIPQGFRIITLEELSKDIDSYMHEVSQCDTSCMYESMSLLSSSSVMILKPCGISGLLVSVKNSLTFKSSFTNFNISFACGILKPEFKINIFHTRLPNQFNSGLIP